MSLFRKGTEQKRVIAAGNLKTNGQMLFLKELTNKEYGEVKSDGEEDNDLNNKGKTLQGKKYDFVKKIMKKCNSTDVGDIMVFCKNSD